MILGDASLEAAERAAAKLRELLPDKADRVTARQVDAANSEALVEFLQPVHTLLSAVPYFMHPSVAVAAIAARTKCATSAAIPVSPSRSWRSTTKPPKPA